MLHLTKLSSLEVMRTYILSSLNYYVGPFAASKNNQQGQKDHEQGVGVESLTMGQTLIPFPPARRSG
jgi:hypothetical protein